MDGRAAEAKAREGLGRDIMGMAVRLSNHERVSRILTLLPETGEDFATKVIDAARPDGGWSDVPETIWCLAFLKQAGRLDALPPGLRWLSGQRLEGGGWGRSARDGARIPVTALALRFLAPEIGAPGDWRCVERLWEEDLASEVQLTYKGGFFLLCQEGNPSPRPELVERTIDYLRMSQNDDGGFGPWRDHPIGSDPWSTGICLVGLCSYPDLAPRGMIKRAVDWLCRTQLPSGLWPYHFIDEGSAYAYWGLKEAARLLEHG